MHSKGKPIGPDADLDGLAKRTVGMSGADLANVINEAALLTARENGTVITGAALEEAVDRVVGGPRRKGRIISEHEKKITAYHEGGHTLAAWAMPDIEPIYKVTILARGRTGGHAVAVPEDDKGLMTRSEMIARLVFAMGGRAAEELVFREPTTGAVSDIEQATKIARAMVTEYGMSAKLGAVKYGTEHGDPFLGRTMGTQADYSPRGRPRHRRRGPQAHRGRAHRGVGDPHRIPRRARHLGRRAAGEGDPAPGRAGGDLRRRRKAARGSPCSTISAAASRRTSRRSRRPASWRSSAASPGPRRSPSPRSRRPSRRPAEAAAAAQAEAERNANGANGSHGARRRSIVRASRSGPPQPDYGAPAGWHAPGWPPQQPADYGSPAAGQQPHGSTGTGQPAAGLSGSSQPASASYPGQQGGAVTRVSHTRLSAVSAVSAARPARPGAGRSPDRQDEDVSRSNPPAHG